MEADPFPPELECLPVNREDRFERDQWVPPEQSRELPIGEFDASPDERCREQLAFCVVLPNPHSYRVTGRGEAKRVALFEVHDG